MLANVENAQSQRIKQYSPSSQSFHITEENNKLLEKGLQQKNKSNFEESGVLTLWFSFSLTLVPTFHNKRIKVKTKKQPLTMFHGKKSYADMCQLPQIMSTSASYITTVHCSLLLSIYSLIISLTYFTATYFLYFSLCFALLFHSLLQ